MSAEHRPTPPSLTAALERAAALGARGGPEAGLRFVARDETARFLSWGEIRERALGVAARIAALSPAPGERIGLVFPTGPGFFDAFFGILLAGAVPVPLYPPVRLGRLDEYHRRTAAMLAAAGAPLVLADRRVRRLLGETVEAARAGGGLPFGCRTLDELPAPVAAHRPPPVEPADLALVQFSSGTTVEPKPVALSHRAVMAQVAALDGLWPELTAERPTGVSWLPLYHDMGLIGCIFPALELPSVMTLIGPEAFVARPAIWLRTLSRYRATISPAPNFAYALAVHKVREAELDGVDLSAWKVALNGAEAVAPAVLRAFRERYRPYGLPETALTPVYGLSEAALAVTFSALDRPFTITRFDRDALAREGVARPAAAGAPPDGVRELASVGRPLAGFEVRVMPEGRGDGEAAAGGGRLRAVPTASSSLPAGRVGRLWVRGPSLMDGYLGRPDDTARALVGGWLDTGDLGFVHQGDLYLVGRAKDVIILRGRNHAPEEIEQAVWEVPGVRRGCVVAASDLPPGAEAEVLVLLVESTRPLPPEDGERLAAACARTALAATGLAAGEVEVLAPGTLPRTSSGKLRRGDALALYRAGELEPPAPVTPLRLAGALARSGMAYARSGMAQRRRGGG
ncbi:MAG TPA: AMP-binding protein [Thermoanaerobaculia bacterium]